MYYDTFRQFDGSIFFVYSKAVNKHGDPGLSIKIQESRSMYV